MCLGLSITSYLKKVCDQFNIWKILKALEEKKVYDKYYTPFSQIHLLLT